MSFDAAALQQQLQILPEPKRYCVAYSGGCDSHVLLHALATVKDKLANVPIYAFHVNHQLQKNAADWESHCISTCKELNVAIETCRVDVQHSPGQSLEACAREARYQAFDRMMQPGDMLLLAHHQDDQAETLLLQMLRGAGVHGVAAMPVIAERSSGWLVRPLLDISRQALHSYANAHNLNWIEDPSNDDESFDRNYLRHRIMPLLTRRWPSATSTLGRAARHQAEAAELLDELAERDFAAVATSQVHIISLERLTLLSRARQANLLRYWIKQVCGLPLPDNARLVRILNEVLSASVDKMPLVSWRGAEVRRYRNCLYALVPAPDIDCDWSSDITPMTETITLPTGETLITHSVKGRGIRHEYMQNGLQIRFRQGGETCRLPGREHHHELKKLFQEWGVPPWQRERVPLVFAGEQLAQIVGYDSCAPFAVEPDETGIEFRLTPNQC